MTFLDDRRRGAEEAFFARQNEQLRVQLRPAGAADATRADLAAASGLQDEAVLEGLMQLKVGAEGAAALSLIPLVAVAWADGEVTAGEREALLAAARQAGLAESSQSYHLFAGWLDDHPPASLLSKWKEYVAAVLSGLAPEAAEKIRVEILTRARTVAEAGGGFLGIGRVSAAEDATLQEIEQSLQAPRTTPSSST